MTALLQLDGVSVTYGGLQAVSSVSLSAQEKRVLVILGANGAGKSSLARAIAGLVPITSGTVRLGGETISGQPAHSVTARGVSYIPERGNVFTSLTVEENLRLAARHRGHRSALTETLDEMLEMFPSLAAARSRPASALSGGERQMLALARGLATRPSLLVVDELSTGLAPQVMDRVYDQLAEFRNTVTIVLIEQFVHRAVGFGDDCLILKRGSIAWQGACADAGEQVLANYLG